LNRKLMVLNLVLAAVVVYAGFQFRGEWRAARAREAATLGQELKPAPPPPFTPLRPEPPVLSAGYADIAQKMLFDQSRNSTVVIEVAPLPPPPPMPALPTYHGMMNLGDGPTALMGVNSNAPYQEVRPGGLIGPFKLLDFNSEELSLEWEGQVIHKKLEEVTQRGASGPAAESSSLSSAGSALPAQPAVRMQTGPGADTGAGFKSCDLNDSSPVGAVVDGYRKALYPTPFGQACRWDPVRR
jgi:hypothetical protein